MVLDMNNVIKLLIFLFIVSAVFVSGGIVLAQYNYNNCQYHSYRMCTGSNLYWYDSCGNQQDIAQYCSGGCYNNSCQNNNNNYSNCNYHAYRLCVGNNIYWYDSCGNQQDLFQSCSGTNMICRYGQCTYYQPVPVPNPYITHYSTKCFNDGIYWYDSYGAINTLYKTCADNNTCTLDSCSAKKCSNVLKCDGSTCATGSQDYNTYCQTSAPAVTPAATGGLSISFFVKPTVSSVQWQKSIELGPNSTAYFSISVANNSTTQINGVNVSANIPNQIASLGNLQVDGVAMSGDIITGINIGSLALKTTKVITFEGKTQTIASQSTSPAGANITANGAMQSDSLSINFSTSPAGQPTASVSASKDSIGILDFLKRWYLWILVGLVLLFLFVVVFRRLSSNA